MIYLKQFRLPSGDTESDCFHSKSPTYYTSLYPFQIFPEKGLEDLTFSDVTIFCGSNGSGKSTLLNVIAQKLRLQRDSRFNKTELYDKYVYCADAGMCYNGSTKKELKSVSRIITSDDVFNHILNVRERNAKIDTDRTELVNQRFRQRFIKSARISDIDFSDPESFQAYRYFTDAIQPGGLYLLDEPENSLSVQLQMELAGYLLGMARFYRCQFIISTHSPFMLAIPFARVYDMDSCPVVSRKWTDIASMRAYLDFFKEHEGEF